MALYPVERKAFVEGLNVFSGKVYSFALTGLLGGYFPLFYNKALFSDAGVAKPLPTYTELRQTAAKITQAGQDEHFGIVHGLRYPGTWAADLMCSIAQAGGFTGGYGTDFLPAGGQGFGWRTGRFTYSGSALTNALTVWIGMRTNDSVFPRETTFEDEQAKMLFATNKAAMIFGGDWNVGNTLAYNPDADFDVVLAPTPDDGVRRGYYTSYVSGYMGGYLVSSFTKNPQAVWEVIRFLTSLEYQEGYVRGGYGSSFLPAANKPENYAQPQMAKFAEWGNTQTRFGPVPELEAQKLRAYLPSIYPNQNDVLETAYLGKAGFEALSDLDKRLDAAVDGAIKKAQEAGVKVQRKDFVFPDWDPARNYVQTTGK